MSPSRVSILKGQNLATPDKPVLENPEQRSAVNFLMPLWAVSRRKFQDALALSRRYPCCQYFIALTPKGHFR